MNILKHIKKPTPEQLLQWGALILTVASAAANKKVQANVDKAAKEKMKEEIINEIFKEQNS